MQTRRRSKQLPGVGVVNVCVGTCPTQPLTKKGRQSRDTVFLILGILELLTALVILVLSVLTAGGQESGAVPPTPLLHPLPLLNTTGTVLTAGGLKSGAVPP